MRPPRFDPMKPISEMLDEIQGRADAATAGPYGYYWGWDIVFSEKDGTLISDYCHLPKDARSSEQIRDDMAFHAAARADVPKLVEALRVAMNTLAEVIKENPGESSTARIGLCMAEAILSKP